MDMLRLLHFSDLHLGVETGGRIDPATGLNQRWVDVCDRFDEVCAAAESEGVHAVLFSGDAFKNQHPNPTLQSLFASRVRRLSRGGAAVFLLVGNHDLPKMAKHAHPFSIYEALEVEGVVVGDQAKVYDLALGPGAPAPRLQVAALPHFSRQEVLARHPDVDVDQAVAQRVAELGAEIDPAIPSVFVGHCHVNQAEIGSTRSSLDISEVQISLSSLVTNRPFPYYALGHVHKRQVLCEQPLVSYAGSLERTDFGEGERADVESEGAPKSRPAEPKGYYRVDLVYRDGAWAVGESGFREVGARRFVTVNTPNLSVADPLADLRSRVEALRSSGTELAGAFVRIVATLPASERGRLISSVARDLVPEAYEARLTVEATDGPLVRDPRFARRMTETEALESYLETRDDWAEDREHLWKMGRELIAEVADA